MTTNEFNILLKAAKITLAALSTFFIGNVFGDTVGDTLRCYNYGFKPPTITPGASDIAVSVDPYGGTATYGGSAQYLSTQNCFFTTWNRANPLKSCANVDNNTDDTKVDSLQLQAFTNLPSSGTIQCPAAGECLTYTCTNFIIGIYNNGSTVSYPPCSTTVTQTVECFPSK